MGDKIVLDLRTSNDQSSYDGGVASAVRGEKLVLRTYDSIHLNSLLSSSRYKLGFNNLDLYIVAYG